MKNLTFYCEKCCENTEHLIVENEEEDPVSVCLICQEVQPAIAYPEEDIEEANAYARSLRDDD